MAGDDILNKVAKMLSTLEAEERELRERLTIVSTQRERYESARAVYEEMLGQSVPRTRTGKTRRRRKASGQPTWGDRAEKVLVNAGGGLKTSDLMDKVREDGGEWKDGSYSTVLKTLMRDERFVSRKTGFWALAERNIAPPSMFPQNGTGGSREPTAVTSR